jgi:hypothetical protein
MNFRKPIVLVASCALGAALVAGRDKKHVEPFRYQQPATLTSEPSYSTIAPPILVDYGALIDFQG